MTKIIGLILAGGRSTRMGGNDKAFIVLRGKRLLAHLLDRLKPQVDEVVINSNVDAEHFHEFSAPVIPDILSGYLGPLAGIHAGLMAFPADYLLTVAVDLPFIPHDLAARLKAQTDSQHCGYATDGKHHALAILWPPGMAVAVKNFLNEGKHSIRDWLHVHGTPVAFQPTPDTDIQFNVNSPEDLEKAELFLSGTRGAENKKGG
jgi:molybdopterin-guanine dinucleotide biosynthesis protein A